jgi:chemotaxis response regulator CheB|tara:strand:+ start:3151 stop:3360 length:210 start_codon:yes stop_codon:yes gene_type:complete
VTNYIKETTTTGNKNNHHRKKKKKKKKKKARKRDERGGAQIGASTDGRGRVRLVLLHARTARELWSGDV